MATKIKNAHKAPDSEKEMVVFETRLSYDLQSSRELGNKLMDNIGNEPFWETCVLSKKAVKELAEEVGFEVTEK